MTNDDPSSRPPVADEASVRTPCQGDAYTVDAALALLANLVEQVPVIAITGAVAGFRRQRRWATAELVDHQGDSTTINARIRISCPPHVVHATPQDIEGAQVVVHGRFTIDRRYGPVQFTAHRIDTIQDRSDAARATAELTAAIRREGLDQLQQTLRVPTTPTPWP